ncbi:MAG: glycosyltransferase [Thermoguttaceae bacterium]
MSTCMTQKRVVFASPYCMVDNSSGAAIATRNCMQLLSRCGLACQAFCSSLLDFNEEICFEQTLTEQKLPYEASHVTVDGIRMKLVYARVGQVPVTVYRNQSTRAMPGDIRGFLAALKRFLECNRPDVVLTYGGGPAGDALIDMAKRGGAAVVFGLHNFAYTDARAFRSVDKVVVPSEFSKQYYRERLGLECHVLPNVIDYQRVKPTERVPQYLTFVNPQPEKGLFVFARIAEQVSRRRPDIPMLIVESRGRANSLEQTRVDLSGAKNLFYMTNTTDPRKFYGVTKVMLMPSLCNESFGLVAAEAMTNGVPVLASNRGALPEVIGEGGFLLDIPARYTPETRDVPNAEEVEPWLETILRLWDDEAFYRRQSAKALRQAERWEPARLRPLYSGFFGNVRPQSGPPVVPAESASVSVGEKSVKSPPDIPLAARDAAFVVPPLGGSSPGFRLKPVLRTSANCSNAPFISVITPVYNGMKTLERAVRSVVAQTFANWELLLVDDCSADDSRKVASALAAEDPRVRLLEKSENSGIGATRNVGLRSAQGRLVAYLDQDDEYDPRYLERLAGLGDQGDIFIFGYDVVYDDEPQRPVGRWQPELSQDRVFGWNVVTPLGIAHRREWIDKVGEFNELVWIEEDTDLVKRFARAGARFAYVAEKSGRYHVRLSSQARAPTMNRRQREAVEKNWHARKPIYGDRPPGTKAREIRSIAYVSSYGTADSPSEATTAVSQSLELLGKLGFSCHAFRGAQGDGREEASFLEQTRPDVLLHFGDSPVWKTLVAEAKTRDIPVVFWLYDRSCTDRTALWLADYVIVPSESDRQHYWQTLGLACFAIPNGTEAGHAHREFFGNIFVQPGLPYIPVPIRGPADRSTGLRRTYVVCPAIEHPAGGVKKLYDLVDLLNVQGFPAAIVHPLRGFRCTWFENQTPVCQLSQVTFAPDDLVVLPETLGPRAADIAPTARKLIFNQNSYYTFADYSSDPKELTTPYTRNDALGVMVVSEDSENYLRHAFPEIRVYRYRYGIDPGLFSPRFPKQKKLCYMPRKNVGDALQVINLLKFRGALEGWTVQPIDGMSPPQVAEVMRQSAFFLSFGHPEGFGLPPAEAMACGCVVVGYHGRGGREYFRPEFSYPIEMGDILGFAQTLENLLREFDRSPEGLETAGRRAAEFIHSYCPLEQEASRVAEIWTELQGMMRRRHVHHFGDLVVNDFREFSGLSTATIEENINRHSELAREEWRALEGDGFDAKAARFYGRSQSYIYDLLSSNYRKEAVVEKLNGMHPKILQSIKTHAGHRFLEFGGGVGVMCQLAHEWGKEVTYVDLPGLVADFAAWRFQRHGWPIRLLLTEPRGLCLEEQYDIIFSDAVLEHVVDPDQVARELCTHTAPRGLLVLLVDLGGPSDDWPMHRSIDIVHVHELIEAHGFRNTLGRHSFASVWAKLEL